MEYAELVCYSNFSFLEGASHPEELLERALVLGLRGLALTDRDGVYGVVRAYQRLREIRRMGGIAGQDVDFDRFRLIVGARVTVAGWPPLVLLAVLLAQWLPMASCPCPSLLPVLRLWQ